jgi:NAD(P)H-nitrite reductase large subunit
MAGGGIRYGGSLGMNSIDFFGLPVVSLGAYKIKEEERASFQELKFRDAGLNIYKKLILRDNRLLGAVLAGAIKNSGVFLRLIREKIDTSPFKDKLLQDNFGYPDIRDFVKEKEYIYF